MKLYLESAPTRDRRGHSGSQYDYNAIAHEHWLEELLSAYENDRILGVGGHIEPLRRYTWWFPLEQNWMIGYAACGSTTAKSST
jgi:hypothetical protein